MSQSLPTLKQLGTRAGRNSKLLWAAGSLALLAAAFALFWGNKPAVQALQAQVEANVIEFRAPISGQVREVLVQEGQKVSAGQVLVVYDDSRAQLDYLEARAAYQAALQGLNPGWPDAGQLEQAVADLRLAVDAILDSESAAQQQIEHWSSQQARALLALRNPTVTPAERALAMEQEAEAASHLAGFRQQREDLVQQRQRLEQRIEATRNAARTASSLELTQAWQARLQQAETALEQTSLRAPETGRVVEVLARSGQQIASGEIVVSYLAEDMGVDAYWVTALFRNADADKLATGLDCRVQTQQSTIRGRIDALELGRDHVLARIGLEAANPESGLEPGQAVQVLLN